MKFLGWCALAIVGTICLPGWAAEQPAKPVVIYRAAPGAFSDTELRDFLEKAHRAEAISDPLKRCLAYPDPPDSAWSPDTVHAYCVYRTQETMAYPQVKALIESGQAAKLDAYLKSVLDKQFSAPEAAGALDHVYYGSFPYPSPEVRRLIDAWKRQSPDSAFALAASGMSYKAMAARARGTLVARDTPPENFERMHELLAFAVTDLDKAVTLEPRMTPAYATMVSIGMLESDNGYAERAARKGLGVQPSNYSIYTMLMWRAEPKWGGSLREMQDLGIEAQKHVKENPMLRMLLPSPVVYVSNLGDCNCTNNPTEADYRMALSQLVAASVLDTASDALDASGKDNLAVVYESETLRFAPGSETTRAKRVKHLAEFGQSAWAASEASSLAAEPSLGRSAMTALIAGYKRLGDARGMAAMNARLAPPSPHGTP